MTTQISPIISIVFNMITVRVGIASERRLPAIGTIAYQTAVESSDDHVDRQARGRRENAGYEMKSITVEISRFLETDADSSSVVGEERKRPDNSGTQVCDTDATHIPPDNFHE